MVYTIALESSDGRGEVIPRCWAFALACLGSVGGEPTVLLAQTLSLPFVPSPVLVQ